MNLSDYDPTRRPHMTRRILRGFDAQAFAKTRQAHMISVSDLARMSNVAPATIFNWESGRGTPQIDLLARVMSCLATPIDSVIAIPPDQRSPGDWRAIPGMTQAELATAAGIATTTLRGIERADAALTDANAATLAALLDISADEYRAAYQRARQRPPGTPV